MTDYVFIVFRKMPFVGESVVAVCSEWCKAIRVRDVLGEDHGFSEFYVKRFQVVE